MFNQNRKQKIKCLFEFHDYKIPHKIHTHILLCEHCKRFGYYKGFNGFEVWYEYDEKGNLIHYKNSSGYEVWYEYNKKGNEIHCKWSDGREAWYDEKGEIVKTKKALK